MEQTVSISNEVSREKGIPGSTLKIIAIITMFIDHIGAVVLEGKLSDLGMAQAMQTQEGLQEFMAQYGVLYLMDMIMRLIGRMGFPIFCFLLIEGFIHTRSRLKYGRNLLLFALISEVPFDLAITRGMGDVPKIGGVLYPYYQNVFFTLFLGLLCMCGYEFVSRHAEEFGKRMQKVRCENHLTQEQLADLLNISRIHVARIERGARTCSIDLLVEIADALHVSTDFLLTGNPTNKEVKQLLSKSIFELTKMLEEL